MKKNSPKIIVIFFLAISLLACIIVFIFAKTSDVYTAGEEYRLLSITLAMFAIFDILIYWLRRSSRKNKYFKLTRSLKEPDSPDLDDFKESQRMLAYLFIIHLILLFISTVFEIL